MVSLIRSTNLHYIIMGQLQTRCDDYEYSIYMLYIYYSGQQLLDINKATFLLTVENYSWAQNNVLTDRQKSKLEHA